MDYMDYQESYIFTDNKNIKKNNSDIAAIIDLFKKHDIRVSDDGVGQCVAKLTFKKKPERKTRRQLSALFLTA